MAQAQAKALVLPRLLDEAKARGELNHTLSTHPNLAVSLQNPRNASNNIIRNLTARARNIPQYATRRNANAAVRARLEPIDESVRNLERSGPVKIAAAENTQRRLIEARALRETTQKAIGPLGTLATKAKDLTKATKKVETSEAALASIVSDLEKARIRFAEISQRIDAGKRGGTPAPPRLITEKGKVEKNISKAVDKEKQARDAVAQATADLTRLRDAPAALTQARADAARLRETEDALKREADQAKRNANTLPANILAAKRRLATAQRTIQPYLNASRFIGKSLPSSAAAMLPWRKEEEKRAMLIAQDKAAIAAGTKRPPGWGQELYNPSTRELIDTGNPKLNVLQFTSLISKFKEYQKPIDLALIGYEFGVSANTTMYEFIIKLFLNPEITMDNMVSFYLVEGRPTPGCDAYESFARLFVFFRGISNINPTELGDYRFIEKIELKKRETYIDKVYETNKDALTKIKCYATKGSGVSDITIMHNSVFTPGSPPPENRKKVYLMSVKWLKDEMTPQDSYDIEKLHSYTSEMQGIEPGEASILVFLKNRGAFTSKCGPTIERHPERICEQIYGWVEDVKPFLTKIRTEIFRIADERKLTPLQTFDELYNIH